MNIVDSKEFPYGELEPDGCVRVIKNLLLIDYNNSPIGKRHQLGNQKFADEFLALLPLVVNGVEQKNTKGSGLTSVETKNVKIRDNRDIRRDGDIIPNAKTCRSLLEFKLGGKKVWNTDTNGMREENGEFARDHEGQIIDNGEWTVLRANRDFEFGPYKEANSDGKYR